MISPDQWQALAARLTELLETALQVEPAGGITDAWQKILSALEVPAMDEERRFAAASEQKLLRGAPIDEVRACLDALLRGADEAAVERYVEHYASIARRRPVGGGMFGYALASASQQQHEQYGTGSSYVLTCPDCGGPRLRSEDLRCEYCGGKTSR